MKLTTAEQWFPSGISSLHAAAGESADDLVHVILQVESEGALSEEFPREDRARLIADMAEWLHFVAASRSAAPEQQLDSWSRITAIKVADRVCKLGG